MEARTFSGQVIIIACLASTHILASHPAAGHLEVELAVVLRVERVLGAGVEQRTHRLVAFEHQIDVACNANAAALLDSRENKANRCSDRKTRCTGQHQAKQPCSALLKD